MAAPAVGSATQGQSWTTNLTATAASDRRLQVRSGLAGANGTAFVAGAAVGDNRLFALHSANGSVRWSRALGPGAPEGLSAPARVTGGGARYPVPADWSSQNVFVADYAGTLHALDAGTGTADWTAATGFGSYVGDPLPGNRTVYATAYDPVTGTTHLQAYDARDGSRQWSTELGEGVGIASPAGTPDRLVVAVGETAYGVDPASGSVEWTADLGTSAFAAPAIVPTADVAAVSTEDGTVTALALGTGEQQWQADVGENATAPILAGNSVVVGGTGLHAFDPTGGSSTWTAEIGSVTAAPIVADGQVHAVTGDRTLHTVNATTGESVDSVALSTLDAPVRAAPAAVGGGVVVADTGGLVSGVGTVDDGTDTPGPTPTTASPSAESPTPTPGGASPAVTTTAGDGADGGAADGSPAETTTEDGPGFGVVSALVAVLALLVVRRSRGGE